MKTRDIDTWQTSNYNMQLTGYADSLINEFSENNIPVILFKGIRFLIDGIIEPGERILGDIDLLIKPSDLKQVRQIFTALGIKKVESNGINAFVFLSPPPAEITIDLHTEIVNVKSPSQTKIYHPNNDLLWKDALALKNNPRALTLSPEDELIYLCFHILKERFANNKWTKDILRFLDIKQNRINRALFMNKAKKYGTYKLILMMLKYFKETHNANITFIDVNAEKNSYKLFNLDYYLFRLILKHNTFGLRELLWMISMDSSIKKITFIKDLLLYLPVKLSKITNNEKRN